MHIWRTVFDSAECEGLNGSVSRLIFDEPLDMQIVQLIIEVERGHVALRALTFSEEDLLASQFTFSRSIAEQASSCRIEFRRRRKVEHVLRLRHVTNLNAIQNVHAFLDRVNLIAVEICSALLVFV